MNKYESIIIIKPTKEQEKVNEVITKYKELLESFSDRKVKIDDMGTRKLAYTVKEFDEGNYLVMYFYGEGKDIAELERQYRIDDDVIKFMTVKFEEEEYRDDLEEEEEH